MYRVKNMEPFKDGNVIGGRFLAAGEILVVSAIDMFKIRQSGGVLEELETLIPNPKKVEEVAPEVVEVPVEARVEKPSGKKNAKK